MWRRDAALLGRDQPGLPDDWDPVGVDPREFELDGQTIPNPLRSFVFTKNIVDHLSPIPVADYGKPKGYETVRYPLSGLVGRNDKARPTSTTRNSPTTS